MQCLHRRRAVVAVDERDVQRSSQGTEHRVFGEFFFAHAGVVVAHQRTHDQRVNLVPVVEDKHRRALFGEVLLAEDVEADPAGCQHQPLPVGGEEVHPAASAAGQKSPPHRTGGDRHQGADPGQGAHRAGESDAAAAGEPQDRPPPFFGHRGHLALRVGGPRVADQVHQRHVFIAVGVEIAVLEVDVVLGGEPLDRIGFARTPQDRFDHTAGEHTVLIGLEPVGQGVGDPQKPGHRVDLDGQCRRTEHHGVAAVEVSAHQLPHLRVDPGLDLLGEHPLTDLVDVAQRSAAQRRGGGVDQPLELDTAELMVHPGGDHADQLTEAHVAVAEPFPGQDDPGEPGDKRAVQVEEGADLRARRAGGDLGHRAWQAHIPWGRHARSDPVESVKDVGRERGAGSPASASTSSNPSCRHRANSVSSVTDARS